MVLSTEPQQLLFTPASIVKPIEDSAGDISGWGLWRMCVIPKSHDIQGVKTTQTNIRIRERAEKFIG